MSISAEYALEHKNAPAVLCCRAESGTVLNEHNLEDPAIFDDLVDSGLLKLDGALTIGQVLGVKLTKTADSLTPVSADMVEGVNAVAEDAPAAEPAVLSAAPAVAPACGNTLKLHIDEGKGIDIELPLCAGGAAGEAVAAVAAAAPAEAEPAVEEKVRHTLKNYTFPVNKVVLGKETSFENGVLTVRESLVADGLADCTNDMLKDLKLDIVSPDDHNIYTDSMMDVQPIAVKKEGAIGSGVTFEMTGVVMMLTGMDEAGIQVSDAASSNGIMAETCVFDRPGSPDESDIIIRVHATIKAGCNMERPGPMAAHKGMDVITEEIRQVLKKKEIKDAAQERVYKDVARTGKPRVLLVKEIMGQGAMHDNLILPEEPCGYSGARPNVDLGNMPVFLRTNEVRDGGIHALTCITPDTKETTRHYWREPLIKRLAEDEEINFLGVLFVGSPQANTEKFYVSERIGATVEAMDIAGCIVTTEGFGNNHVDFQSHIQQIGMLGIPVVGVSFCGIQGALVVGNQYCDAMVDNAVTPVESDKLAENTITDEVAIRAVAMMKDKMMGKTIKKAEKQWSAEVNEENLRAAKEANHEM